MRVRIAAIVAILAVFAVSWFYRPAPSGGVNLCPLRFLLGVPCLACGLTRSFCSLAHFEFGAAVRHHLFGPLVFAGMTLAIPYLAWEVAVRRRLTFLNCVLFSTRVAYVLGFGLMFYHAGRLCVFFGSGGFPENDSVVGVIVLWVAGRAS